MAWFDGHPHLAETCTDIYLHGTVHVLRLCRHASVHLQRMVQEVCKCRVWRVAHGDGVWGGPQGEPQADPPGYQAHPHHFWWPMHACKLLTTVS